MIIYIMRHGETVWNKSRLLQGSKDISLSTEGIELARKRSEQFKDVKFDVIYSSPLERAYMTACIMKGERDIPIIKDDRIREINFGVNEGQSSIELQKDKSNPFCKFFDDPGNYVAPDKGENLIQVCNRTKDFLQEVIEPLAKKEPEKTVLIAGHGAMNKGLMCHMFNRNMENYWEGGLQKNCGIYIVELDNNNEYHLIDEV